ncbi:uncharacterized protein LOC130802669 [Amaranthus tricolor]|uniref:uncharacterized protein LOC130802669 n=1 Tax=Amaranthus tricolor TaxID=29722 RepID=UPI002585D012|nr:uncharacterized protein LOC130802669 [Amaranthus tricolor]
MKVDPDDLSMDYLMSLANKCNGNRDIQGLFYLLPGYTLKDGLRKINKENVVIELHNAVIQMRTMNVYMLYKYLTSAFPVTDLDKGPLDQPKVQPKKLAPRRSTNIPLKRSPRSNLPAATTTKKALLPDTNVNHPLEPEIHSDFIDKSVKGSAFGNSSSEDEDYEVGLDDSVSSEDELEDADLVDELVDFEGSSDEEFVAARHKFRGEISKPVNSLERVQREAAQGTHGAQQTDLKNDVREGNVNFDSRG